MAAGLIQLLHNVEFDGRKGAESVRGQQGRRKTGMAEHYEAETTS